MRIKRVNSCTNSSHSVNGNSWWWWRWFWFLGPEKFLSHPGICSLDHSTLKISVHDQSQIPFYLCSAAHIMLPPSYAVSIIQKKWSRCRSNSEELLSQQIFRAAACWMMGELTVFAFKKPLVLIGGLELRNAQWKDDSRKLKWSTDYMV